MSWVLKMPHWGIFCTSITLGILGISILCALFADSLRSGGAAAWLSLLTYPLAIPLLFSGVQVGQELLSGQPPDWEAIYRWLSFSAVFDGLSLLTALWLAGPLSSKE